VRHEFGERPPKMMFAERHDAVQALLLDRAHKSLRMGVQLGAWAGVRMTRTPAVSRSRCTPLLHFESRSQMRTRPPRRTPSTSLVRCRMVWRTNASSGCDVEPTRWTRRECSSITKAV
jgi:hypothetical protein